MSKKRRPALTSRTAATKLRRAAKRVRTSGSKLAHEDSYGLYLIAELIAAGNKQRALSMASHMDTAVREEIPRDVWMYIGGRR